MANTTKKKGNCFICKESFGKIAMKNHIMKKHQEGEELCYLLKAEGFYSKDYWLYFSVPLGSTLEVVDKFLRQIWCECCGHLSSFSVGRMEVSMNTKLSCFQEGDALLYEYDFGTTTCILLTVVEEITRPKQKGKVLLYARNEQPDVVCDFCGGEGKYFNAYEYELLCEKCESALDDEEGFILPIVNSPRCGACGYEGEMDIWTFVP